MSSDKIIKEVGQYYTEKLLQHGPSPKGVDWNSLESQELRFFQLLKIIDDSDKSFSLLDYGCGYGSMFEYMKKKYNNFSFTGYDISYEMIKEAAAIFSGSNICWTSKLDSQHQFDFVVASGIFNVRLKNSDKEWIDYILETLHKLNMHSKKGFSFNVLTKYSDAEFMKDYLFYADPCFLFDYCKKNFSRKVSLIHDYPLYEFSILIRKD